MLLAASDLRNDEIADRLGTAHETASRRRTRYFEEGDGGLLECPRSVQPGHP